MGTRLLEYSDLLNGAVGLYIEPLDFGALLFATDSGADRPKIPKGVPPMTPSSRPGFVIRQSPDGSFVSVCLHCLRTAASGHSRTELAEGEGTISARLRTSKSARCDERASRSNPQRLKTHTALGLQRSSAPTTKVAFGLGSPPRTRRPNNSCEDPSRPALLVMTRRTSCRRVLSCPFRLL